MQAATLKRPTGQRSKEASKQKSRFSETAKICSNPLQSETTNDRREKGDANPGDGRCPFLQSRDDVPVRLLLVIGETNNNNCQKRVSVPFASLKSSSLALRFLQQNPDGQTSYQETTAASLSPWFSWNSPIEGRWSNVKTTCSPSSTIRQQPTSPEVLTSRSPSSSSSSSYQSPKLSDRKRWESLWKDSRPPDIAYRFQHYSDIRRYMDQYRKDHVHRKLSREEEPINAAAAAAAAADIRPVVPPLCPVPVPVSQSFRDPARLCLTQRAFRFAYVRQKSDLSYQRSSSKASANKLSLAHQQQTKNSSFAVDSEGNNYGADDGKRCLRNCQTTRSSDGGGGGGFVSLPRCNLRVYSRKRNSALLPEFLTNRKKNAASNAKDRSLRLPSK